jgi:nucleoside-triphosphatase
VILSGPVGGGKSSAVRELARELESRRIRVGGIVAPRVVREGRTVGYDVEDLSTGTRVALAGLQPPGIAAERYHLAAQGIRFARRAITAALQDADVIVVDEVGPAELTGEGHAQSVRAVAAARRPAVLVVRSELVGPVTDAFGLGDPQILDISQTGDAARSAGD